VLYAGQLTDAALPPGRRRGFADKLLARLRHTEQLVADMLSFARGERYRPEVLDLRDVVREAVDIVAPRFRVGGGRLVGVGDGLPACEVLGNAQALTGVVVNLLTNALEHGGAAVTVRLGLEATPESFRILVEDDGPGVSDDLRTRVFEPFFTTRSSGTGLGLAVAHSVAVEHGGNIRCTGARFELVLPRRSAGEPTQTWRRSA
jgi:two-component system sensor histidine kinase FlrB